MLSLRRSISGLLAVMLALAVQLGVSASVPRVDPAVQLAGIALLCHPTEPGAPRQPVHLPDCLLCPLCAAIHAPAPVLMAEAGVPAPLELPVAARAAMPPPSRAPPVRLRPPAQPRAPPIFS